jgi:hypothetical protein
MRFPCAWATGVFIAAIVIGCGPGKELPDEIPKSSENGQGGGEVVEAVPAKSDPAAVEIAERAIKAHTQNNPTLLPRGRISRVTAEGMMKLPIGPDRESISNPAHRTFLAEWPDKIKYTVVFGPPYSRTQTLILHSPFTWNGTNGQQEPNLNPRKAEEDMRADGCGLHWLVLLFPLKENGTILFGARKGLGVGTPPADVISVSMPGRPVYRLHVSSNSGLVMQIDYQRTDQLGPVFTEWMLADHKPFGGWLLPTDLKLARTTERPRFRDVVEEWKVETWEFPEKLDDHAFDAPK